MFKKSYGLHTFVTLCSHIRYGSLHKFVTHSSHIRYTWEKLLKNAIYNQLFTHSLRYYNRMFTKTLRYAFLYRKANGLGSSQIGYALFTNKLRLSNSLRECSQIRYTT